MIRFIDDLEGAILDNLKLVAYFLVGFATVSLFLYALTFCIQWIRGQ